MEEPAQGNLCPRCRARRRQHSGLTQHSSQQSIQQSCSLQGPALSWINRPGETLNPGRCHAGRTREPARSPARRDVSCLHGHAGVSLHSGKPAYFFVSPSRKLRNYDDVTFRRTHWGDFPNDPSRVVSKTRTRWVPRAQRIHDGWLQAAAGGPGAGLAPHSPLPRGQHRANDGPQPRCPELTSTRLWLRNRALVCPCLQPCAINFFSAEGQTKMAKLFVCWLFSPLSVLTVSS